MSDLFQLEQQLANAKELLERRKMAQRLHANRDFRKLIIDDFCGTEAARLVQLSGDPALDKQQREDALAMGQASGHLKRYLSMMITMANVAERDMNNLEEAISEARAEADTAEREAAAGDSDDEVVLA